MNALVPIVVAVLNALGPGIMQLLQMAFSHPALDDNGKAALQTLGIELKRDEHDVDAVQPLPDPKPTAPG